MRRYARLVLDETGKPQPGQHRVRSHALDHRVVKHLLEPAAMDGKLGVLVACVHAAKLAPDLLALAGQVTQFPCSQPHLVETRQQSQFGELGDGVGQGVDADTHFAHLRGLFDHLAGDAARVQHQGGGQSADACACDQDAHEAASLSSGGRKSIA